MIKKISYNVSFEEWEDIANTSEYATFFHTPQWSKFFVNTYTNMELFTKGFVFDDGKLAILPLIKVKSKIGVLNKYYSGIAGVYGGCISKNTLSISQYNEIIKWMNMNLNAFALRINPYDKSFAPTQLNTYQTDFTDYIELKSGIDNIFEPGPKAIGRL